MFCPKCSSNIDDNSSFCPVCGLDIVDYDNKLKEEAENLKIDDATYKINAISTFNIFADLYKDKYTDIFSINESLRLKKLSQYKLFKYLYAPLSIFILIGVWYFVPIMDYTIPLIFISLFLVIMLIFNLIRCKTNFTKKYTDKLDEPYYKFIYECFGIKTTVPYKWDKMFSLLKKSDFLFGFNVINTLNVLKSYGFIYDNNKVNIEDLNLTYNSGYGKYYSCIGNAWLRFNGIIIIIENKYSNENILSKVTAKTMHKEAVFIRISAYVLFIILLLITIPFEYYKNIFQVQNLLFFPIILFLIVIFLIRNKQDCLNINNKEFSKKYIVESLDTKQAEKFTTTNFYKILKDFESAYDTNNIKIANFDNTTVIAIETNKKFLETADLRHSLYNPQCFFKTYNQVYSIINLIKYIDNN